MKKIGIMLGAVVILGVVLFLFSRAEQLPAPDLPEAISYEEIVQEEFEGDLFEEGVEEQFELEEEEEELIETEEVVIEPELELETSVNLAVPFTPQAPHANWEMPYQEACEEASILMVRAYYENQSKGLLDANQIDAALFDMVAYQEKELGFTPDMTAEETVEFITEYYGYTTLLLEDPTVEQLKDHLRAGRPVLIPAAGRQLGNPYFTAPGPIYHMLVLRGFTSTQFIVNDPGTRRGEAYLYDTETIMTAMHDWNGGDVENGKKVAIIIYP
jgi:hypothetical protein